MIKRLILIAAVIGLLVSCPDPTDNSTGNNSNNSGNPNNPQNNTTIVFDNTQGICAVAVYDSYQRREQDKIVEVPAGQLSAKIEWTPGTLVPFYFLYRINLKGINGLTLDYVPKEIGKDQTAVRIDANTKTTVSIHKLDETVSSPDALLSNNCYVLIQNNSSFSFQLLRGSSIITPDKASGSVVNSGERAQYTVIAGSAVPYQLLVGADYVTFTGSITNFEAGSVYCFVFDGNIWLINEVEMKLSNVDGTPQNTSAPPAVGAPVVTAGDSLITLRWTAVERADNYDVYVSTVAAPPSTPEKTVTGVTTVLPGLVNKTAYYVWIKAVNGFGSSDFSPYGMGIPWPLGEIPATPARPVIIPGINQLTINWEECGGASSYEVFISASSTRSPMPEIITEKTSATVNNLQNDVIYYVWVRAVNNAGQSGFSVLESGTPKVPFTAPYAPARPVLTAGSRELTVSWQAVELAAAYEVWMGTSDNSAQAQKYGGDITGTETVISGLVNETTYYVWIKAKNIVGASGFSLPANARPSAFAVLPPAPALPTVTPGSRALTVSWPAVEGALSYEVWTGLTNNADYAEKRGADVSGASVTLANLVNETTYYIWIKSKNNKGSSGFSPRASGTPSAFAAAPPAPLAAPSVIAGSAQLTVNWQAVEGANSYEVWVGLSINPTQATKSGDNVPGLSYVVTGLTNGTTYYVWIRAKNNVGTSEFSPTATGIPSAFNEPPKAPAVPSVSTGNGQITVTWEAAEGATAYEVWLGTSNSSASAAKNGADVTSSLSAEIYGLTNGTTYYVWIKAKNSVGASGFSPVASGKPIANGTAPVLSSSNGQLSVTWAAIAGADQYEIFCGNGITPPQAASQTVNAPTTSATISGLVNGTTYNVWVRGRNATGTGAISGAASAKPVGNMGPVTVGSGNGLLTVSWLVVNGADQYEVYYNTGNSIPASPAQTINAPATTATISGLTNGTTYYVWVKPKNSGGAGSANAAASGVPMATPGNLSVSAGNQQITVSWSAVPGAGSYEIYYGTTGTIPAEAAFTNVTELSKTITGLSNGITYYFWVKAVNANGTSGASPMAACKPIGNMGAVTLALGNEQLSLSWDPVAGADQYEVYYSAASTMPGSPSQTINAPAASAVISGLANGTTYYVWVKPKNSGGSGNTNATVSGTPMATPGSLTVVVGNQQITVSWATVPGASSYEIYQSTTTTIPAAASYTVTGTSRTITDLTNGTTYNFWVKAVNANGTSAASPMASGKPIGNMGTVTLVSGNSQLTASWSAVTGADEYEVYRSTTSTIPASPSQTVSTTMATISSISNGTVYYIWIKGKNTTGTGNASAVVSGKPIGNMGTVSLVSGNGQLTSSWSSVSGADEYEVYYSDTSTMPSSPAQTVSTTTATIGSLTNGTTYYVWVKPKNANGAGAVSTAVNAKPLGTPGAPAVSAEYRQLLVTWTAVAGADEYEVYYGTTSAPTTLAKTITGTSTAITGLTAGTTYYVRLRAKNAKGVSDYGPNASGTPDNIRRPGLYRNDEKVGTQNLADSLTYISTSAVANGDDIYIVLGADESSPAITLSKRVGITLSGYGSERKITLNANGRLFTINTGVTLTLDENITLVGRSENSDSLVYIGAGNLIINNKAKITGNTISFSYDNNGGGVYVYNGILTMNGGEISGNNCSNYGGGVFIYGVSSYLKGTFIMNSGTISGNTVSHPSGSGGGYPPSGGGVYNKGSFTMSGGEISGNTVTNSGSGRVYGGGVYVDSSGTFTMSGGEISGNTAASQSGYGCAYGGGVYVYSSGTFTMSGGNISGNSVSFPSGSDEKINLSYGGGVYVYDNGTFTKSGGGTITGYASDMVNGNVVKDSSGVARNNVGHAVYVRVLPKYRETTAGASVNLDSRVGGTAGGWVDNAAVTSLTANTWAYVNSPVDDRWFKFTATASTQYVHFGFNSSSSLYAEIYDSSGARIGNQQGLSRSGYISTSVTAGQEYYILVYSYYGVTGLFGSSTYQITFSTSTTTPPVETPSNATLLTVNTWANGDITTSGGDQWFKFTATASTQYIHASFGTLNSSYNGGVYVQVYNSSGANVGNENQLYNNTKYVSTGVTSGQEYYIRVRPYNSSYSGTYNIAFNTSSTPPAQ